MGVLFHIDEEETTRIFSQSLFWLVTSFLFEKATNLGADMADSVPLKRKRSVSGSPDADSSPAKLLHSNGSIIVKDKVRWLPSMHYAFTAAPTVPKIHS